MLAGEARHIQVGRRYMRADDQNDLTQDASFDSRCQYLHIPYLDRTDERSDGGYVRTKLYEYLHASSIYALQQRLNPERQALLLKFEMFQPMTFCVEDHF